MQMNRREFTKNALMLGVVAQNPFGDAAVEAAAAEPKTNVPPDSVEGSPQVAFARAEIKTASDSTEGTPPVEFAIDPVNRLKNSGIAFHIPEASVLALSPGKI